MQTVEGIHHPQLVVATTHGMPTDLVLESMKKRCRVPGIIFIIGAGTPLHTRVEQRKNLVTDISKVLR